MWTEVMIDGVVLGFRVLHASGVILVIGRDHVIAGF